MTMMMTTATATRAASLRRRRRSSPRPNFARSLKLIFLVLLVLVSLFLLLLRSSSSSSDTITRRTTYFAVDAWKVCDGFVDGSQGEERHGRRTSGSTRSTRCGICPDHATCCPLTTTDTTEWEWGCISSKAHDPPDGSGGTCCDFHSGCSYGYDCAVATMEIPLSSSSSSSSLRHTNGNDDDQQQHQQQNLEGLICQQNDDIDPNVTPATAKQTPRPKLCHIPNPDVVRVLQKFPIRHRLDRGHGRNDDDDDGGDQEQQQPQAQQARFHATYYSSVGSILLQQQQGQDDRTTGDVRDDDDDDDDSFETVIVVVHGSARNADDYLCMGLSLQPQPTLDLSSSNSNSSSTSNNSSRSNTNTGGRRVLVVAPKFPSVNDDDVYPDDPTILRWEELPPNGDKAKTHTWRWGADAVNTTTTTTTSTSSSPSTPDDGSGVSSYDVIDQLVEYIVDTYRSVKRVAVVGHSAGGQVVQRWSLLSSSRVWDLATKPSVVAIAANPRSYCYLDGRRMIPVPAKYPDDEEDRRIIRNTSVEETTWKYDYPDPADVSKCPTYNHWQWGLEDRTSDDELPCPYKDHALNISGGSTEQMARRYADRKVVYLTGSEDVEYLDDRCETMNFQGINRHERAYRFWESIQQYFHDLHGDFVLNHEIHTVEGSPHDHTLMFQSAVSLNAIFG